MDRREKRLAAGGLLVATAAYIEEHGKTTRDHVFTTADGRACAWGALQKVCDGTNVAEGMPRGRERVVYQIALDALGVYAREQGHKAVTFWSDENSQETVVNGIMEVAKRLTRREEAVA